MGEDADIFTDKNFDLTAIIINTGANRKNYISTVVFEGYSFKIY